MLRDNSEMLFLSSLLLTLLRESKIESVKSQISAGDTMKLKDKLSIAQYKCQKDIVKSFTIKSKKAKKMCAREIEVGKE